MVRCCFWPLHAPDPAMVYGVHVLPGLWAIYVVFVHSTRSPLCPLRAHARVSFDQDNLMVSTWSTIGQGKLHTLLTTNFSHR